MPSDLCTNEIQQQNFCTAFDCNPPGIVKLLWAIVFDAMQLCAPKCWQLWVFSIEFSVWLQCLRMWASTAKLPV